MLELSKSIRYSGDFIIVGFVIAQGPPIMRLKILHW